MKINFQTCSLFVFQNGSKDNAFFKDIDEYDRGDNELLVMACISNAVIAFTWVRDEGYAEVWKNGFRQSVEFCSNAMADYAGKINSSV